MRALRRFVVFPLLSAALGSVPQTARAQAVTEAPAARRFEVPDPASDIPGVGPIHQGDWFLRIWDERRSGFADRADREHGAVVFFGDSITQGWGDRLRGAFGEMPVANRGIGGDTTRGMLYRLDEDVLSLDPACVVMLMGTNDIELQNPAEEIAANVVRMVEAIAEHNADTPVVLCEVMPSSTSMRRSRDKITTLNRLLRERMAERPGVTVVDTWTLFANAAGDAKPEEFPDLLHPNDTGYAKWAAAVRPVLATLGFVDAGADPFTPEPGFEMLFNGEDLTGWGLRPTPPSSRESRRRWRESDPNAPPWPLIEARESFDGLTESPDGRFRAVGGRLVVATPAEGRKIQQLWTDREFGSDFVLRLEFRATPNADSGVYLRDPQLQCRDFTLAGPYYDLQAYKPQGWNTMEVTVTGRTARCLCNGEVIEEAMPLPESGPIGLEGDRGQMEYRRLRVKASR